MKKATVFLAATCGLLSISSAFAQTIIYDDNFANDSSLSTSYLNINNISGSTAEWAFTPNTQLELTTAASGKVDELVGQFSPQALSGAGQSVTFTASFNSPSLTTSGSSGSLLIALDNSRGTPLSPTPGPIGPTATTGATAS